MIKIKDLQAFGKSVIDLLVGEVYVSEFKTSRTEKEEEMKIDCDV